MRITRLYIFLPLLIALGSCQKKDSFHIYGDLRCVNAPTAYLLRMNELGELAVLDSAEISEGKFSFKGKVNYPTMCYIQIGKRKPIDVFVENSDITLKGSLLLPEEVKVTGSTSFDEVVYLQNEYNKLQNERNKTRIQLENAKKQKKQELAKSLERKYNNYPNNVFIMTKQFVADNPTSVGAAYFVCTLAQTFKINNLKEIVVLFDPLIKDSEYVRYLNEELVVNQKLALDSNAPEFNLPTLDGDTAKLSDYKDKYLLIEFWASWCKNCRERNMELKNVYKKYQPAGLEILSISLDREKSEWEEAVANDSLTWRQASDLLYWESPVSKYYRVQKIPCEVLIDPKGKIVIVSKQYAIDAKLRNIFGF